MKRFRVVYHGISHESFILSRYTNMSSSILHHVSTDELLECLQTNVLLFTISLIGQWRFVVKILISYWVFDPRGEMDSGMAPTILDRKSWYGNGASCIFYGMV